MKSHKEIHDMIQLCSVFPDKDSMGTVLDICEALLERLANVERAFLKADISAMSAAKGGEQDEPK